MVNQLSTAAAGASTSGTSTTSAQAAAAILRYGGLSARDKEKANEEPIREEDGQLHIAVAETMLKWHAEAVGRCVELSSASDVCVTAVDPFSALQSYSFYRRPKHIFALLRVLAAAIGSAYIETAIET